MNEDASSGQQFPSGPPPSPPLNPPPPGQAADASASASSAQKQKPWLWAALGLVVGLVLGVAIGAASSGGDDDETAAPSESSTTTEEDQGSDSEEEEEEEEPETTRTTEERTTTTTAAPYVPVPEDFQLAIVETERSCFGSAGCNITYRIDVTYNGLPLDSSESYTVVYEVYGGDDPQTKNFEVEGNEYVHSEEIISTPPNPVLSAAAVRVLDN